MISERGVVGMFLNGHKLDYIVACLLDSLQVIVCKIFIQVNFAPFLRHSDMCLVDTITLLRYRNWTLVGPLEFLVRVPPETIEKESGWVLNGHTSPRRVPIPPLPISLLNANLVFRVMRHSTFSI